jgi:hypothetical protein
MESEVFDLLPSQRVMYKIRFDRHEKSQMHSEQQWDKGWDKDEEQWWCEMRRSPFNWWRHWSFKCHEVKLMTREERAKDKKRTRWLICCRSHNLKGSGQEEYEQQTIEKGRMWNSRRHKAFELWLIRLFKLWNSWKIKRLIVERFDFLWSLWSS